MKKKFYLSTNDTWISGVCGGIGEYCNIDIMIIRLIVFALLCIVPVITILAYFLVAFCAPHSKYVDFDKDSNDSSDNDKE